MGSAARVSEMALEMACGPVSDSMSTELTKSTLQAGRNPPKEKSWGMERVGMVPRPSLQEGGGRTFQAHLRPKHLHPEMRRAHPETSGSESEVQPAPAGGDGAEGRTGLGRDLVWSGHSPAPCFSRSVVELAVPELFFDSSVGSETKI